MTSRCRRPFHFSPSIPRGYQNENYSSIIQRNSSGTNREHYFKPHRGERHFSDRRNVSYRRSRWENNSQIDSNRFLRPGNSNRNHTEIVLADPRPILQNVKVELEASDSTNTKRKRKSNSEVSAGIAKKTKIDPKVKSEPRDRLKEKVDPRPVLQNVRVKLEAKDLIDKRRNDPNVATDAAKKIRINPKVKSEFKDLLEAKTKENDLAAVKEEPDRTYAETEINCSASVKTEKGVDIKTEPKYRAQCTPTKTGIKIKKEPDENRSTKTTVKVENLHVKEVIKNEKTKISKVNPTTRNRCNIENKPTKMELKTEGTALETSMVATKKCVQLPLVTQKESRLEFEPLQTIKNKCQLGDGDWEAQMLSRASDIPVWVARNVISMLKSDCTIPFIARYRTDKTDHMDADKLRHIKDNYEHIKMLKTKAENIIKLLTKNGKLTDELKENICSVQSLDDLEFIYAPYKQGGSRSKAEKARALGLEEVSMTVLEGSSIVHLEDYLDDQDGLQTISEITQSVQHLIADVFSKNPDVLDYLRDLEKHARITINSKRACNIKKKTDTKNKDNKDALGKFEIYYDFQSTTKNIQPHQILALNRGENLKILSVKVIIDDLLSKKLYEYCENKWLKHGCDYPLRTHIFKNSFKDSYVRLISPLIARRARSELNRKAQYAAIGNFASNLKNLLQMPPVKGCSILGIDPGFRHGFKFALINHKGDVLWTKILNFDTTCPESSTNEFNLKIIKEKLIAHKCELIAIGNGSGCRIIEEMLTNYINDKFFLPEINVRYTIVNERGASVYSCTSLATEEFPDLDPKLISAVFIARSLQDPLNEYVKVEPKHLGVGMYQHDIPEKQLNNTVDEIVSECVSFTGVDLNTASIHLLRHVSGLGANKAANLIEWRRKNGPFTNREQLTLVKMIGEKTYEQCCGFVRVLPQTAYEEGRVVDKSKYLKAGINSSFNPLDMTWIHPESYTAAYSLMSKCDVKLEELGTEQFIDKIRSTMDKINIKQLASDLNITVEKLSFLSNALMKPKDYDYRSQFAKPMFKQGLNSVSSLKPKMSLTGVIGNVTDFGAFVDIGVGKDGLIHKSNMNGHKIQVGDRVDVRVMDLEIERGRINLFLSKIIR